jgi:hypothetical protein
MSGGDVLTTIAQLAMAVTGFSGIVIVFKRQPGQLSDLERFRISLLVSNSLAAVFLSLLPFAFFHFGWRDETIWRMASGACLVFEAIFISSHISPVRRFLRAHRELFNLGLLSFVTCGHIINMIAQLLNALGMFHAKLSIFVLGMLWLLFHGAFQFGRILFVQLKNGDSR